MKIFKSELIKGVTVLSVGGLITKLLGALYRVPLTNILGAEGIGVYQAVFPLYSLLLTASSTGVPNGIAKIISSSEKESGAYETLKTALLIFAPIGAVCSVLLAVFCKQIAVIQGNYNAYLSYLFISPSVALVSIISCYRGFFQGKLNMKPTAVSQIIEQAVKLLTGLTVCSLVSGGVGVKAGLAALAVTASELITVIYLIITFKKQGYNFSGIKGAKIEVKKLLKTVIPVMLSTVVIPTSRTVESFFIINLISKYSNNATALYGLYSGAVESLVGVPVQACYSVAVASVPIISKYYASGKNYVKKINQTLIFTLVGGVFFSLFFAFLPGVAVSILYPNLSSENAFITINLLKLSSLSVILLPLMQSTASILIALEKTLVPPLTALISVIIKLIASYIMLQNPTISIFSVVLSDILCYFVATFLNLMYIIYTLSNKKRRTKWEKLPLSV